ncbi:unnamed protein product [Clonostachys rosea f. rosea IK726]|uniref:Uncharacterized protein n=1 Tax=Clonostachys rosea f. rosea IK726 TaxID=1349383 RepID=A0ACA9TYA5_BIOOC|nr:unnamed protein product [Clonostachys rosea f. rosea IK726]
MNSSTWKPHGLIRTPQLEYYYQEARAPVDPNGNTAQDREDKSIRLFAQLLAKYVFPGNDYAVVPGPTPSTQARKPSDLSYVFVDAKKPTNVAAARVAYLEQRALSHCTELLRANPTYKRAYACTVVGTRIRCWMVIPDFGGSMDMTGMWSWFQLGSFEHYLDVGLDANRAVLERSFNQMRNVPPSRAH